MCSVCGMYFFTIKVMSMHHRYCKHVEDKAESSDTLDVGEKIAEIVIPLRIASIRQQKTLCVLQMQEME